MIKENNARKIISKCLKDDKKNFNKCLAEQGFKLEPIKKDKVVTRELRDMDDLLRKLRKTRGL